MALCPAALSLTAQARSQKRLAAPLFSGSPAVSRAAAQAATTHVHCLIS